jgi:hypothetical protein
MAHAAFAHTCLSPVDTACREDFEATATRVLPPATHVWDPMLLEFELGQEVVLPCLGGRSGWDPMDVELLAHSMTSIEETGALLVIEEVVVLSFVDTTQSTQVGLAGSADVSHSTTACEIFMRSPSATTPTLETVMFLTVERM